MSWAQLKLFITFTREIYSMIKTLYYREFQFARWIFLIIPMWISLAIIYFSESANMALSTLLMASGILFLIGLLFYGMKTEIDNSKIRIVFGIGLIRKTIKLNNVKYVEVVRNKWYHGWGIRLISNGWLYNITGLDGVEIKQKDRRSVIRIGTKQPAVLRKAIFKGITKN